MCFTNSYRLCTTHKHALTCLSTTNQRQANHAIYKPLVQSACTEGARLKTPLLPQWQIHVSTVLTAEVEPVVHTISSEQNFHATKPPRAPITLSSITCVHTERL